MLFLDGAAWPVASSSLAWLESGRSFDPTRSFTPAVTRHEMRLTHAAAALAVALVASTFAAGCGKSVSQGVDDGGITVRVRTALLNAPDVSATEIAVSTNGGVVTLSGKARSAEERDRAIDIARKINGVTDVRSNMEVPPPAPVSWAPSSRGVIA